MTDTLPKYGDMLKGVGEQLAGRRRLIVRRTFLVYWPHFLTVVVLAIILTIVDTNTAYEEAVIRFAERPDVYAAIVAWIVFGIAYMAVMILISGLEKLIWIDSHFDGHPLTPEQSWRMARRLALRYLGVQLLVLMAYIFLPFSITLIVGIAISYLSDLTQFRDGIVILVAVLIPLLFAAYLAFHYWFAAMPVRLSGFLFLDQYGPGFSMKRYFRDLHNHSRARLGGSLARVLVADFGAGSINAVVTSTTNAIAGGVGSVVPKAFPLAKVAAFIGQTISKEMTAFGRLAAYYLVYRSLRKHATGKEQHMNPYVYSLAQ